jgi:hypothetical protein
MKMRKVLFAVVLLLASSGIASADSIIATFVSATPVAGGVEYEYAVTVDLFSHVEADDFLVFFDFLGFVSAMEDLLGDWDISVEATTSTPPVDVLPPDDPAIPNVVFTYQGDLAVDPTGVLGTVTLISTNVCCGPQAFGGQDHFTASGTEQTNQGLTLGPTAVPVAAPEPASFLLMGMGLGLVGMVRSRRRRLI